MKLRIRGNSLRLRLSKPEVEQVAARGWVEDSIRFAPDTALTYRLDVGDQPRPSAAFGSDRLTVVVPKSQIDRWLEPGEISIQGKQPLGAQATLSILVEKDFECLNPRPDEDSSDLFAHPDKAR